MGFLWPATWSDNSFLALGFFYLIVVSGWVTFPFHFKVIPFKPFVMCVYILGSFYMIFSKDFLGVRYLFPNSLLYPTLLSPSNLIIWGVQHMLKAICNSLCLKTFLASSLQPTLLGAPLQGSYSQNEVGRCFVNKQQSSYCTCSIHWINSIL